MRIIRLAQPVPNQAGQMVEQRQQQLDLVQSFIASIANNSALQNELVNALDNATLENILKMASADIVKNASKITSLNTAITILADKIPGLDAAQVTQFMASTVAQSPLLNNPDATMEQELARALAQILATRVDWKNVGIKTGDQVSSFVQQQTTTTQSIR